MSKAGGLRRRCPVDAHNSIALACSSTVCTWVKAFAFGENGQPIVRSCSRMALWGSAHNLVWAGAADSVARGQSKKQRQLETLKTSTVTSARGSAASLLFTAAQQASTTPKLETDERLS